MRAVVYEQPGVVSVRDVPDPALEEPDDAIVRVGLAGICGSDLHFFHGKAPLSAGETIGHEAVGVVERIGPAVAHHAVGERVVVSFDIACGSCWFCLRGETQLCEDFRNLGAGILGGNLGGAQAELLRVPHADVNLLAVPDDVDDERALFVGDVLTTAHYASSIAGIEEGDLVAVVGAGPLGWLCAHAASLRGAGTVAVLDRVPERLASVERSGFVPVNVDERNAQMAIADLSGGRGADVVIEAVGSVPAFESAVDVVRRGGRVCIAGMYSGEQHEIALGVYWARALRLRFAGICPIHSYWEEVMGEVAAGRLDPSPLVSHRLPLDRAAEGYALFDGRRATKVVLRP